MKMIETCMKLYNDKDHHANGNTNSHSGDVDNRVIPVTDQTSESGFKIIADHNYHFLPVSPTLLVLKNMPGNYHFDLQLFTN
jgi:hypothetical protein